VTRAAFALATDDLMDGLRADVARLEALWRELADSDCRICRGRGQTSGYIGPGKTAVYACSCTGWKPS
jgi:hypothetical protein